MAIACNRMLRRSFEPKGCRYARFLHSHVEERMNPGKQTAVEEQDWGNLLYSARQYLSVFSRGRETFTFCVNMVRNHVSSFVVANCRIRKGRPSVRGCRGSDKSSRANRNCRAKENAVNC